LRFIFLLSLASDEELDEEDEDPDDEDSSELDSLLLSLPSLFLILCTFRFHFFNSALT
jgi:hypothetical protein